jgi:hypothetical protein
MKVSEDFKKNLAPHIDLVLLNASEDIIFFLDPKFTICGFNNSYLQFARENGQRDIESKFGLGRPVLEAISPRLRSYYEKSWEKALLTNQVFTQEYECSSSQQIRHYYQTAYPIHGGTGLVVTNHCKLALAMDKGEVEVMPEHTNSNGFVEQCSNCRKIRNHSFTEHWDWIPKWVDQPPHNTSHGICEYCLDHYYPDYKLLMSSTKV